MLRIRVPLLISLFSLILFRFYDLGLRPPHHDESVNGWFVDGILKSGFYHYDPSNYHGPLYFYFLTLTEMMFGRSVETLRSVTVVFGGMLTFIPFLFRRWIGERAAWIAAFAFALSPAVVFYSRYAIHEIVFAFFCVLFFYFWLRAREETFSWKNTIGLGLCFGAIASLKENFVLMLACLLIAEGMIRIYGREWRFPKKWFFHLSSILIGFGFIALVYSALGRDKDGILNFFRAFELWSDTGSKGNGHEKPLYYWVNVFAHLEWSTLIGLLLAPLALVRVSQPIRLISVLTFGIFMAYTIVNYKTPWCLLSFQWGFLFLFGYWLSRLWDHYKGAVLALIALVFSVSAYHAYDLSYDRVDADGEFYIYGQTYRTLMPPLNAILNQVKANPELKKNLRIQIISGYTWPLPYLLGEIEKVGYYTEKNVPAVLDADYLMIDENLDEKYRDRIKGSYQRNVYPARQWASSMVIYSRN